MRAWITTAAEVVGFVLVVVSVASVSLVAAGVVAGVGLFAGGVILGSDG